MITSRFIAVCGALLLLALLQGCAWNPADTGKPSAAPHWLQKSVTSKAVKTRPDTSASTAKRSYEVKGLHPKVAAVISNDIVMLLSANFLPAKHRFVFRPPAKAVLGAMLERQLRQSGYGLLSQSGKQTRELRYFLDVLSHDKQAGSHVLRLSIRLDQWRLDRLYKVAGGKLIRLGMTSNLKIRKPARAAVNRKITSTAGQKKLQAAKRYSLAKPSKTRVKPVPEKPHLYAVQVLESASDTVLAKNAGLLKGLQTRVVPLLESGVPVVATDDGKNVKALQVLSRSKQNALQLLAGLKGIYPDAFIQEIKP